MMTAVLITDLHWTSKRSLLRVGGSYSRPPEICNVPLESLDSPDLPRG